MRPGNLAPNYTDLGAPDLLVGAVDESNLLATVETEWSILAACFPFLFFPHPKYFEYSRCAAGVLNTVKLEKTGK